ncbi:hypothetical protein ACEPAI_4614 [Sanghuangporus weigelae]
MREKRKRNVTSTTKGLSAGEKLNRNRLLAECDLRWNWIGTEAKHVSEITRDHCLRAAGLVVPGSKRPCPNKFTKPKRRQSFPHQTVLKSEDSEDVIVISDEDEDVSCEKKRCRDNPYCLNYLGQEKWEDEDKAQETYLKLHLRRESPHSLSRGTNPVGLKNLGATCYANAFLQVWFQDLAFRSGVYRCQPSGSNVLKFKDSPIFQLQVTFTALQEGSLSVFNPIKLVESLRLRTSEQQDAQEFSKLFMSHLDDEFKKQSDPELRSLLSSQFEGKMINATVCDKCKTRSERETSFLELEVNLEKNGILEDRIASLLAPERLDENNKYLCSVCEGLQNATRYTEIRSLPPVLHISLLRFVYDLTTYERKKSKLPLKFPPYLNMKPFLLSSDPNHMVTNDVNSSEIYELRGVLLHKGPSAYHGHYEAQVYNQEKKKWYQFNDEVVTPLSSFFSPKPTTSTNSEPMVVDSEEEEGRPTKRQKRTANSRRVEDSDDEEMLSWVSNDSYARLERQLITLPTKYLSSKDAYMLIYARRQDPKQANARPLTPPPKALELIRSCNEAHKKACGEYGALREEKKAEFAKAREIMRDVYLSWNVMSAYESSVIVSKAALERWLQAPLTPVEPEKGKQSRMDEDRKEIPPDCEATNETPDTEMAFPDKVTLGSEDSSSIRKVIDSTNLLCPHDVSMQMGLLNPRLDKDMKIISEVARDKLTQYGFPFIPELSVESVCKRCVEDEFSEKLYQLEHPRLVAEFNEVSATETENEGYWISKAWLKDWQLNKPKMHVSSQPDPSPENVSDDSALDFRSHVYCKHNNLTINAATRRRISLEAVLLLKRLCKDWNPPRWDAEACPTCDVDIHISKESKLEQRKKAENEKAQFYRVNNDDLFGQQGLLPNSTCAVIPSEFIHRWRKWLVRPGEVMRPIDIDTQSMLCDHGKLILDLSDKTDLDNDLTVLTMPEWDRLRTFYNSGPLIKIECFTGPDEPGHDRIYVRSELPCCWECRTKRRLDYLSATLTIIRLDKGADPASLPKQSRDILDSTAPSFDANGRQNIVTPQSNTIYVGKTNGTRQSRRLQEGKNPGRLQIQVQREWSIKDVKFAINKAFKVPTISQRLYYNGVELDDNSKTIAELKILNKDILYLREIDEDMIVLDSDTDDEAGKRPKKRVEGDAFKGTLLSGGSSPPRDDDTPNVDASLELPALQKQCSICTLYNLHDAKRCEACESEL